MAGDKTGSDPWKNKPWMYAKPRGAGHLKEWRMKWGKLLLQRAEEENIHLITNNDLKLLEPFNKLDQASFQDMIEYMLNSNTIRWWDAQKTLLRIYWRSLEGWADCTMNAVQQNNKNIIYGFDALFDLLPRMKNIPVRDLNRILDILVERQSAKWMSRKKKILKII